MATNFNVGIIDFSKLFVPLSSGTAYPTATGYKLSDGQDLNEVFAALGTVNAAVAAPTGFLLSDGVTDLADIFNGEAIITPSANVVKTSVGLWDYYTVTSVTTIETITIKSGAGKTFGYMAVAGGGGGANYVSGNNSLGAGAGGAGGFLDGILKPMTTETITINIGAGGVRNTNGENTKVSFLNDSTIDCVGGGSGGSNLAYGKTGGSGGGGSGGNLGSVPRLGVAGGIGTVNQGFNGGKGGQSAGSNGTSGSWGGGGGGGGAGGAGGAGVSTLSRAGYGGIGKYSIYSGNSLGYAGGGSGRPDGNAYLYYGGGAEVLMRQIIEVVVAQALNVELGFLQQAAPVYSY
jgi:hypothetical protein